VRERKPLGIVMFEILCAPAYAWMWVVGWLLGADVKRTKLTMTDGETGEILYKEGEDNE